MSELHRDRVLAVLDDVARAATLLEASSALARLQRRDLLVVYVQDDAALAAAALPAARVLAQGTRGWVPFAPADVERAWRAQAGRLRALAERASAAREVRWSMRVTRGALQPTAHALRAESDLRLVGGAAAGSAPARAARPRLRIGYLPDGDAAGRQAERVAQQLAAELAAALVPLTPAALRGPGGPAPQADLLVLPVTLQSPDARTARPAPVLWVG